MSISGSSWLKFGLFTVGLGQSFVFVLVPPLARDLGLSEIQTSSIFAISALAWATTSAFWGRTSDKYGRRNIAILGLVGYSISLIALITPLFLAQKNLLNVTLLFPALVLGRLINGLVGSATRPASFAYIADITSKDNRTVKFARLESSFLLGTVAGPLAGGFLFLISNETPFYIFSMLAFIAAIGIYRKLDSVTKTKNTIKKLNKINLISNGDDYQVLFTANVNKARIIQNTSKTTGIKITKIGKIVSGKDRSMIFDKKGLQIQAKSKGYIHQF